MKKAGIYKRVIESCGGMKNGDWWEWPVFKPENLGLSSVCLCKKLLNGFGKGACVTRSQL